MKTVIKHQHPKCNLTHVKMETKHEAL